MPHEKFRIRITDNQKDKRYIGNEEVTSFLGRMEYNAEKQDRPKMLRIDNMEFDYAFIRHIVEEA